MVFGDHYSPSFCGSLRLYRGKRMEPPAGQFGLNGHSTRSVASVTKVHERIQNIRERCSDECGIGAGSKISVLRKPIEAFMDERAKIGGSEFQCAIGGCDQSEPMAEPVAVGAGEIVFEFGHTHGRHWRGPWLGHDESGGCRGWSHWGDFRFDCCKKTARCRHNFIGFATEEESAGDGRRCVGSVLWHDHQEMLAARGRHRKNPGIACGDTASILERESLAQRVWQEGIGGCAGGKRAFDSAGDRE